MTQTPEQENTAVPEADNINRPHPRPVGSLWGRFLPPHIQHIFIPLDPHEQLLPGETMQLEIHLAWYRNIVAVIIYGYTPALLIATAALSFIGWITARFTGLDNVLAAQIPFYLLIVLAGYGVYERFQYLQWRLIKTNNRIIISKPQSDAWYLVDNIDMNSMPKIVDANWAPPGVRRLLQMATGARDLYISLSGLQFEQGSARVKDAIVIPDITEQDARRLKELVFK